MFRHVVLFTWKPEATEEQKQAVHAELAKMPPTIEAIRVYRYGPDAGINPANCDYAVVADFDDAAGTSPTATTRRTGSSSSVT